MATVRKLVIDRYGFNVQCDTDACKTRAVFAIGREGSNAHRRHLLCADCLRDIAFATIEHFKEDREFQLAASEAFGNRDLVRGKSVKEMQDEVELLKATIAKQEVQIDMFEQDAAERSRKAAEAKATRARKKGMSKDDEG